MNTRNTILEALKRWNYTVCETEGIDIILDNGAMIEMFAAQRSIEIVATIYEADSDDVEYIDMLEAANTLNDGFISNIKCHVSKEWMDLTVFLNFDYGDASDLQVKLRKALLFLERIPSLYEQVLSMAQEKDEIEAGPIWHTVGRITTDYARMVLSGKTILYIHGFASSGSSGTADKIRELLPDSHIVAPDLPLAPFEAYDMLTNILKDEKVDIIVGTSMGGMFANALSGVAKILVNPSFHVSESMRRRIGIVPFFKRRTDGATEFEVTEQLCDAYRDLESRQFASSDERCCNETFAIFGIRDDTVDCRKEYIEHYGDTYINVDCGHRLTPEVIIRDLLPVMAELVSRNPRV